MAITVKKDDFLNAIKATKTAVAKNQLQPSLHSIHIKAENGGLTLTATDCTDIARAVIEANYKAEDKFDVCINADRLDNIVGKLDYYVTIELKDANVVFKSGKTTFKCLYIDSSEFPQIKIDYETTDKVILEKENFIAGINKTCFATQNDTSSRSIISGVCFTFNKDNGYELAATDGNRLSQVILANDKVFNKQEGQFVIPKQALMSIARFIKDDVELYFEKDTIIFKTKNFIYVSRLLAGQFPPYKQLIPQSFQKTVAIEKAVLLKALDKVGIMVNERTNTIKFIFSENNLQLITECPDGDAKDDIEIDYTDEKEFEIAFNYKYIVEALKTMSSDVFTFNANGSLSPVLFLGDFNYLLMPIQLK